MCTWRTNAGPTAAAEADIDGGWYDPEVIGKTCDRVRVMCYDMTSVSGGAVGPVSTRPWARDAMRFWLRHVPRRKLVMGLPAYSRDVVMNSSREALSPYVSQPQVPPGTAVQRLWLPYEGFHQYRYTDAQGTEHVFFASDDDSTRQHLETAADLGLDTIGFWHAASVTPPMWAAVREWILAGE
jgi:spore germination protein YaaH